MNKQLVALSTLTLSICLPPLNADEAVTSGPTRTVGSVYGESITAAEIGLAEPIDVTVKFDARDAERWELMGRIVTAFGKPVSDRFIEQRKIEATPEEVDLFNTTSNALRQRRLDETAARLEKVNTDLAAANLADEVREKLEEERSLLERVLPMLRKPVETGPSEAMARMFIVSWKTERELYRSFGGKVIFQQAGPEALDARRRLYEKAEKNGDLEFQDPSVRYLFYYYANMRHTAIDAETLENPWFFDGEK